jgi:hypothetical protein
MVGAGRFDLPTFYPHLALIIGEGHLPAFYQLAPEIQIPYFAVFMSWGFKALWARNL